MPGGPWIFLCREDGSAVLRDVAGPGERPFEGPCYSWVAPTGDQLFAGQATVGVWSVPDLTMRMSHTFPDGSQVYGAFLDNYVKWSPDGENLLLVIWSPQSPRHALYRYRRGETAIEEVGLEGERIEILGWSPDGRWAILLLNPEGKPVTIQAFDAVSGRAGYTSPHISRGESDTWGQIVGWLDNEKVVVEERHRLSEDYAPGDYLRLIDLGAGTERTLVGPKHLWGAALDPTSGTLLYGVADWPDLIEEVPGLYTLAVGSGAVRLKGLPQPDWTIPWDFPFWFIRWRPQIGLYSVQMEEGMVTLNSDGDVVHRFEGAYELNPSPDGMWLLVHSYDPAGTFLYRSNGELVRAMGSAYSNWGPDSKTLFLHDASNVYQADLADDWAGVLMPGFERVGSIVAPAVEE